jgi:hypothetical protein
MAKKIGDIKREVKESVPVGRHIEISVDDEGKISVEVVGVFNIFEVKAIADAFYVDTQQKYTGFVESVLLDVRKNMEAEKALVDVEDKDEPNTV